MATALSFNSAKSWVISLLQASRTPWATTVDGSNAQYSSDTEISTAILTADLECATLIALTPLHPYQTQFVITPPATILNGANTPIRNGMILRVKGATGSALTYTFTSSDISTTTDLVTKAAHGLVTGQAVQVSAGTTLPTGLGAATTYYIYAPTTSTYGFCTTIYNAKQGTLIDITNVGAGTNTVTTQYVDILQSDRATVVEATNSPYLFAYQQGNVAGFWAVEGDTFYTTCPSAQMYYTDVTLTASPQCPEPYLFAVVAGALAKLMKDGSDDNEIGFYTKQYEMYQAQIAGNAKMVPEIMAYTGGINVT